MSKSNTVDGKSNEGLLFNDNEQPLYTAPREPERPADPRAWKLLVIDDDESVHLVTRLVLEEFSFEGRSLSIIDGYSGKEAQELMKAHPDTAVILLDVVMETDNAGLEAVKHIREELGNKRVRIVLRTGQPGDAPEKDVVAHYDINGYKEKSALTAQTLNDTVVSALQSYSDLQSDEPPALSDSGAEETVRERKKVAKCGDLNFDWE